MPFLQSWIANQRQKKLDARRIYVPEIRWSLQLPADLNLLSLAKARKSYQQSVNLMGPPSNNSIYRPGNVNVLFSAFFDKFNRLAASTSNITGFSTDQLYFSREDCKSRLLGLFSKMPGGQIERSSSTIPIGGVDFEQHSFLIRRNGKPIICLEYIFQIIGEHELSVSMTYNNETIRQTMVNCLEKSTFA